SSGYITDCRPWVGLSVGIWTTEGRPGANRIPSPRKGQLGYNTTTGAWEFWNGSAWVTLPTTLIDNASHLVAVNNGTAYELIVSATTPVQSPTVGRIWIQPTS